MRPKVSSPTGTAIDHFLTTHQPISYVHCDRAHGLLSEMLSDLEDKAVAVIFDLKRIKDSRELIGKLHVNDGPHDLAHLTLGAFACRNFLLLLLGLCNHGGFLCHCERPLWSLDSIAHRQ